MCKVLVIIPTYNEAKNVALALKRVMEQPYNLNALVVDDGSPDGTANIVRQTQLEYPGRIELLERSGKLGLGTAYLTGFAHALKHEYQIICEMDADLSHNPDDLPRLIKAIRTDQCDLAIGSRYIHGVRVVDWPLGRLILSYGAGWYTRIVTRLPVRDVTAGFVAYHRRVLESVNLGAVRSNGYSFQVEMKYRAWKKGFRLTEIPIVFTERTEGQSKMSQDIVREAAFKVWELRFRSLFGKL
ncbi:MAG: polyprenol monophosphomannose synthase [Bacteroidota bacterium]|nr:polyprenol monophosphomannose synthase [Bacteroidota bacterium]MDE2672586.1 polyprenol monophosphomannose synthase [Bacteroidota bacterium]MDE2770478.1 polyprenol monophosphomannose synthase [Bacteroidota bacterium]